jgi:hypothetical protein
MLARQILDKARPGKPAQRKPVEVKLRVTAYLALAWLALLGDRPGSAKGEGR